MHSLRNIAGKTIQRQGIYKVIKTKYNTEDIMAAIMAADKHAAQYVKDFAPHVKGQTTLKTCRNIWDFLKNCISYKEDATNWQVIKAPSQLWHDGVGDCKSFSIFTAAILKSLNINYKYRFTGYVSSLPGHNAAVPTHVYVVATDENGREIIIDGVWTEFNAEKKYNIKYDRMPLVYMAGTNNIGSIGSTNELSNSDFYTLTGIGFFKNKIEKHLRTSAYVFLYLFAEPNGLSETSRKKRALAYHIMDKITGKIKLKQESFKRFIRNEIKAQHGKEPEELILGAYHEYMKYFRRFEDEAKKYYPMPAMPPMPTRDMAKSTLKYYEKAVPGSIDNRHDALIEKWQKDVDKIIVSYNAILNHQMKKWGIVDMDTWYQDYVSQKKTPPNRIIIFEKEVAKQNNYRDGDLLQIGKIGVLDPLTQVAIVTGIAGIITGLITVLVNTKFSKEDIPDPLTDQPTWPLPGTQGDGNQGGGNQGGGNQGGGNQGGGNQGGGNQGGGNQGENKIPLVPILFAAAALLL
jgi:uncharacterized membrane protein YgcG